MDEMIPTFEPPRIFFWGLKLGWYRETWQPLAEHYTSEGRTEIAPSSPSLGSMLL